MRIQRPKRKVALLIGVEDYGSASYDTLIRVSGDLNTLKARLKDDGFVTLAVRGEHAANRQRLQEAIENKAKQLLQPQQPGEGTGADSAHSSAAVSQEDAPDPSSTLAVVYYSGHGTVDASTGESCMVAGDGSVVPIPMVQQLFQDVGWLVMLYDACRNVSECQQGAVPDTNKQQQQQAQQQQVQAQQQQQQQQQRQQQRQQPQQLPMNEAFCIQHREDQHSLIAYSCKYAATARDGLFTDELLKGTADKLERAQALALQAVQTMRDAMGATSPQVVTCLKTLHFVLKKRGKDGAAMRVWLEMQALACGWKCRRLCIRAGAAVAAACGGVDRLLCLHAAS